MLQDMLSCKHSLRGQAVTLDGTDQGAHLPSIHCHTGDIAVGMIMMPPVVEVHVRAWRSAT